MKAEFRCIRPFAIDDGQLEGCSPQECFVLGYELALVDEALKHGKEFQRLLHAENTERVESELKRLGRRYSLTWMAGDSSETWKELAVASVECGS